ncbi:ABC transporter permease [Paenibacillus aceris]|uniref:Aldouronate transport system permease protein n=1 Tax=Paenibacillus aceris TaxID=869555 RepID=A0ABS4I428_9BACL|nr:ABC transporter permease subunit [Paenibacillus aceris]MBP1964914.1 putative aldouronate transport system permease protein [Paenibacillus aceris]
MSELLKSYKTHRALIIMFLPGFLVFLLFRYVPIYGLLLAFKDYRVLEGIWASPWAGLDHYKQLINGPGFLSALRNTAVIAILKYVFVFPAPIVLALLLNEVRKSWFKRTIQTVTYLPHFFSWVILASLLFTFLSADGAMNEIIKMLGFEPINWVADPNKFYGLVVLSDIWATVGWSSIIYFAALAGIDPSLYEAAIVDGASRWHQVKNITIPSLMPTIITMLLLSIGNFLNVGFDQIYNLTTAPTMGVADILDTFVLRKLVAMDYELGTAAGFFTSVVGFILVFTANRLVKLYDKDQGLW